MAAPELQSDDACWERLVEEYKERMRVNPRSYVYVPLADALLYLGRINEAMETLSWGLTHLPESRAAKVMLAQLLYDIGDMAGARLLLEDVAARWPDMLEAASLLCRIYEKEGDMETAGMLAESLLGYHPDSSLAREMVHHYSRHVQPEAAPCAARAFGSCGGQSPAPLPDADGGAGDKDDGLRALEAMLENIDHIKVEKESADG